MMDVDIVYLWVDGNDPIWRKKYIAAVGEEPFMPRCIDNGELFLSLTALRKYCTGYRKIFVVHDDCQLPTIPDGIDVNFVPCSQIIPNEYLPSFNSITIESFLHNISEMSERFVYLNDDVVPLCPMDVRDFFDDDIALYGVAGKYSQYFQARIDRGDTQMYLNFTRNSQSLLNDRFGEEDRMVCDHNALVYTKTCVELGWKEFGDEFLASITPIRMPKNIQFMGHIVPHVSAHYGKMRLVPARKNQFAYHLTVEQQQDMLKALTTGD